MRVLANALLAQPAASEFAQQRTRNGAQPAAREASYDRTRSRRPTRRLDLLVGVGAFYVARGINARTANAAQLALEQLLDGLERGDVTKTQPSLLSALAAAAASLPRKY